jgi:MFS family permease
MAEEVTSTRVSTRVVDGSTDVARSDLISWSSIVAGVVAAFALFVLFGAIAVAAGLESTDTPFKFGGAQVGSIIAGLFGVISFVVGGFIAAWTAHLEEGDTAVTHGFLVWSVFVVLLVLMIALGAGAALGSAAGVLSTSVNTLTPDQLKTAGWGTVFALAIALASSILGALLATRPGVRDTFARRW